MPMSLRPAAARVRVSLVAVLILLTACAAPSPLPTDPTGRLIARAFDAIGTLYIVPVSSRGLAFGAAARLSRLDPKLSIAEMPGPQNESEIVLDYGGHQLAAYPSPIGDDPHDWGGWVGRLAADAKAASPILAALSEDDIDVTLFDGVTGALDRFSRYATPAVAQDHRAARDGFGGIGITLDASPEPLRVAEVTPLGPADLAGIRPGDRVVAIDGRPTAGQPQSDVVRQLRGPVPSTVAIDIDRPGRGPVRSYRLQRTLILVPTVTASEDGGVAIFHISAFNQNTTQQLVEDLDAAKRRAGPPLHGIVLDLRGNPGGLLDQAVGLADVFIAKGPIAATVGRNPASRQFFAASGDSIAARVPVVVLIDGGSASASEIVAAALQDDGRAVVVGSASYGKGSVQTVIRLPNDGELTLTWALLVTPSGYLLNAHGVVPTVCTSDLGNDGQALQAALSRAGGLSGVSPLTAEPRAGLDERDWSQLRRSCPARGDDRAIDVAVAERLLADPVLYRQAAHLITPGPNLAAKPIGAGPASAVPGLTGADGSLSSGPRNP
jgi:carboxyl-terminal processing protease